MACNCIFKCGFLPSFPLFTHRRTIQKPKTLFPISCNLAKNHSQNRHENGEDEKRLRFKRASLCLLQSTVTLTVISASLAKPSSAAPKLSEKKRSAKKAEALTPEEWAKWAQGSQGLPLVSDRLMYTELLDLRRENKLKHVIKPSIDGLKRRSEVVLAVLEDNKVVRIVLPALGDDPKFWKEWDELQMNGLCINAYTPPLKDPETEIPIPYLTFLLDIPSLMPDIKLTLPKLKRKPKPPQSLRALELKRVREELKRKNMEELAKLRKDRETMKKNARMKKMMEEKARREEIKRMYEDEAMIAADRRGDDMHMMWKSLANDESFTTFLGIIFFYLFYRVVIVSYKKNRKDYDDRLKIEEADADERLRIRALEREMAGLEEGDELEGFGDGGDDPYMKMAQQFMKSGARVKRARDRKLPKYLDPDADVKFTDVAGLGKIRVELEEIVKFFTHGDVYRRRGVKIPGGILLCGPPGVGKTLLAKAVAGEAGVNFFSISASQFVEMYVGVGASRVRALYQEARENAPAVVFIDELDAVGRKRGLLKGSGGQERDATLNQLLVCLDGFEGRGEVITIASTNRPDILDPALIRPGRFDRKIHIPKPGMIGREEILKVHARKKPMAPDVDFEAVAGVTAGMVGAELANVLEVAAIYMIRDGKKEITTQDLIQAVDIEEHGLLEKKDRSPETWRQMAMNQAALAVVSINLPDTESIEYITIAPRAGKELGYTQVRLKDYIKFQKAMYSRQSVIDHITINLAPRAADELWYGQDQVSTIWAKAAEKARADARNLVLAGFREKYHGLNKFWDEHKNNELDTEALKILHVCYERSKMILEQNRALMNDVVDKLAEQKSLTKEEFNELAELHGSHKPTPPSLLDIRATRLLELQNTVNNNGAALQGSAANLL